MAHRPQRNILLDHWKSESESHSVVSDSLWPHGLYSPWNSPGQNTGVGSLSLLQGDFPTQGSNRGLLHCRWILYQLSYEGSLLDHWFTVKRFKSEIVRGKGREKGMELPCFLQVRHSPWVAPCSPTQKLSESCPSGFLWRLHYSHDWWHHWPLAIIRPPAPLPIPRSQEGWD